MPQKTYNRKKFIKRRSKFASRFRPRIVPLIKKTILKMGEKKYFDIQDSDNVSTIGVMNDLGLATIAVGDGQSNRTGIKIRLLAFTMRWECFIPALSTDTSNTVRILIFQWYDSTVPNGTQILYNTVAAGFSIYSNYNKENAQSYRILYDRMVTLSLNGTRNKAGKIALYGKKIPQKDIIFSNATIPKGSFWMMLVSDSGAVQHPQYTFEGRWSFYDA